MQHVIVQIGRAVVHGEGRYRETVGERGGGGGGGGVGRGGGGHNLEYVDREEKSACSVVLEGRRRKTCLGR